MSSLTYQEDVAVAVVSGPEQLQENTSGQRTFKTIRLDHYQEFSSILKIKYDNNEDEMNEQEDSEFDRVIYLGLLEWEKEETGYEIIHKGKVADKRVLKKLGNISRELQEINTYPLIDGSSLIVIIKKALGGMDSRSMSDYRKTVLYYCNVDEYIIDRCKDSRLGELNVSGFVKRVPRSFVVGDS